MARQPRIQYEGACYHVMCRGDRQEPIFEDNSDRAMFFETVKECCERSVVWPVADDMMWLKQVAGSRLKFRRV